MNFGQNLFSWLATNAQPLVLAAILIFGVYFAVKREFSKLIGAIIIFIIAVGLVFDTSGAKDLLLNLFKKIFGA